jgi:hypothetical protein
MPTEGPCFYCGRVGPWKRCSCGLVPRSIRGTLHYTAPKYCSPECQRADWPSHREACIYRPRASTRIFLMSFGLEVTNGQVVNVEITNGQVATAEAPVVDGDENVVHNGDTEQDNGSTHQ